MEQEKQKKPISKLFFFSPVLIKWSLSVLVSAIGMIVFYMVYLSKHYEEVYEYLKNPEQAHQFALYLVNQFSGYTTLLEGMASLLTIPIFLFLMKQDKRCFPGSSERRQRISTLPLALSFALTVAVGCNSLIVLGKFANYSTSYRGTMEVLYAAPLWLQVVSLGILIPMSEELAFRGLLFKRLDLRFSFWHSALLSSVIFGLMHVNLVQMVYGFFLGLLFAYFYKIYGRILVPILAHIGVNLFAVLGTKYQLFEWLQKTNYGLQIVIVVSAALASSIFVLLQRMEVED